MATRTRHAAAHRSPPHRPPPARIGTRSLTAHVADDIHRAVREFAELEHLSLDEALHLSFAMLLLRNRRPLPPSLDQKLKHHRLTSYLPTAEI